MTPVELSYSKLQAYERCPWLYHLVFIDKWRSGPHWRQALGNTLHETLAAFCSQPKEKATENELYELYDIHWVNEGYPSVEHTLTTYEEGRQILKKFFETHEKNQDSVVATEKEFHIELPGIHYRGMIDRIDQAKDKTYTLIEYKTRPDGWTQEKIADDLQMTLYDFGVREGFGYTPLELKFHFLSSGEIVKTTRSREQTEKAIQKLHQVADALRQEAFQPNHNHCSRCEFKTRCTKADPHVKK